MGRLRRLRRWLPRRQRRAGLGAAGPGRVCLGFRGALPRALATRLPRRLPRGPRRRRRRGHRAGGVPRRRPRTRPLRPAAPVRSVAAPDRRQPGDRLGTRPRAAARGRSGRRRRPRAARARRRAAAAAGRPLAGAPRGDRPALPARLHARGDRRAARAAAGHGQLPLAPGARPAQGAAGMKEFRAPSEQQAGARSWEVVRAAYEAREPVAWPRRHPRALAAGALVAALVAAALSPPGRSVVHSPRKAVGVEHAETELFSLPAPGRLLVTGPGGTWIVNADGSRRRLGAYRDAAWSPHGLFVAATRGNELVALDPKGKVRWSLARRSPRFPAWTGTRSDTRIAYVSRGRLRVVAGDGTGDRAIAPAA